MILRANVDCELVSSTSPKKTFIFHYTGGLIGILMMVCYIPHTTG